MNEARRMMNIRNVKIINVMCPCCGLNIDDTKYATSIDDNLAVTCPQCGTHLELNLKRLCREATIARMGGPNRPIVWKEKET